MALLTCVVCGRSSTRASWNNNNVYGTTNVACDFHSQNAIQLAVGLGATAVPLKANLPRTIHEKESG